MESSGQIAWLFAHLTLKRAWSCKPYTLYSPNWPPHANRNMLNPHACVQDKAALLASMDPAKVGGVNHAKLVFNDVWSEE